MLQIRLVSDLRNKFPDIERIVNAGEPDRLAAESTVRMSHEAVFGNLRRKIDAQ